MSKFNPSFSNKRPNLHKMHTAKMKMAELIFALHDFQLNEKEVMETIIASVREIYGQDLRAVKLTHKKLKLAAKNEYLTDTYIVEQVNRLENP